MRINRRALTDLIYAWLQIDGHLSPMTPRASVVSIAQSPGTFGASVSVDPRKIQTFMDLHPASRAARITLLDTIKSRLGAGQLLELSDDDDPTRIIRAVLDPGSVRFYPDGVSYANPWCGLEVSFIAADPSRESVEPLLYALSTARTALPVGTDTSAPLITLFGASTPVVDPIVIVRNASGTEVGRLTLTVSLAADDVVTIDCGSQILTHTVAGVAQANPLALVTSGTFPILSDEDAIRDASAWPTMELSATSGTPTGAVSYATRW